MTTAELSDILVTARLLRAARGIGWLAVGFTVVAAASFVIADNPAGSLAAAILGVAAIYYAVRVNLDAALLEDIAAERLSAEDLDRVLGRWPAGERSWPDRCRGARRLVMMSAAITVAQLVAIALIQLS